MAGPTVTHAAAVASSSNQLVIASGVNHVGALETKWPFLPSTSQIIERKALAYIEGIYYRTPYVPPTINEVDELSTYLVLSTCCHAFDGWRYLSQAATALLNGARAESLHLAYYAELRAAISILAGSGIGILNSVHFALDNTGNVSWFTGGTHKKAWQALSEWSEKLGSAGRIVTSLGALGLSGEEWAEAFGITSSADAVAEAWVSNWSIDLHALTKDRDRRNEASYRPDLSSRALSALSELDLQFIRLVNNSLEPMGDGKFDDLDTVMIHNLWKKAFILQYDPQTRTQRRRYWRDVKRRIINNIGRSQDDAAELVNTLKRARHLEGRYLLITAHAANPSPTGVFCRALLLLRLAGALLRQQWQEIRTTAGWHTGNNWQDSMLLSYSTACHLWGESEAPDDYAILSKDQAVAQEKIDGWLLDNEFSAYGLWRGQSASLVELCRLERAGVLAAALQ